MSVSGIESLLAGAGVASALPTAYTTEVDGTARTLGVQVAQGPDGPAFGDMLTQGVQSLEALHDKADGLRVAAATGDLNAIHDYTLAATEASVATQLTVTLRNKAVEAFNEIMRMQVG